MPPIVRRKTRFRRTRRRRRPRRARRKNQTRRQLKQFPISRLPPELRRLIWIHVAESIFHYPTRSCIAFDDKFYQENRRMRQTRQLHQSYYLPSTFWAVHASNPPPASRYSAPRYRKKVALWKIKKASLLSPLHVNREARSIVFRRYAKLLPGPQIVPQYYNDSGLPILSLETLASFHRYLELHRWVGPCEECFDFFWRRSVVGHWVRLRIGERLIWDNGAVNKYYHGKPPHSWW